MAEKIGTLATRIIATRLYHPELFVGPGPTPGVQRDTAMSWFSSVGSILMYRRVIMER